jgi:hypothetical protein
MNIKEVMLMQQSRRRLPQRKAIDGDEGYFLLLLERARQ